MESVSDIVNEAGGLRGKSNKITMQNEHSN